MRICKQGGEFHSESLLHFMTIDHHARQEQVITLALITKLRLQEIGFPLSVKMKKQSVSYFRLLLSSTHYEHDNSSQKTRLQTSHCLPGKTVMHGELDSDEDESC